MKPLQVPTFEERQRQKQLSRLEDERALESGEKTREQLSRENGAFHGLRVRYCFENVRRLY